MTMVMDDDDDNSMHYTTQHINACRTVMIWIAHFSFISFVCFFVFFTIAQTMGNSVSTTITDTASCSFLNRCNHWWFVYFFHFLPLISLWHKHNDILFNDKCTHWWTLFFSVMHMWLIAMTATTTTTTKKHAVQPETELRCRVIQCNQM